VRGDWLDWGLYSLEFRRMTGDLIETFGQNVAGPPAVEIGTGEWQATGRCVDLGG